MKKHKFEENIFVSVLFCWWKRRWLQEIACKKLLTHDKDIQQDNNTFIDFCGRVYENLQNYLKKITLPNCIICYLGNGAYCVVNGTVTVEYGISPAGKRGRKFLRYLDNESTVLIVAAIVVSIAKLCVPVVLHVVAG